MNYDPTWDWAHAEDNSSAVSYTFMATPLVSKVTSKGEEEPTCIFPANHKHHRKLWRGVDKEESNSLKRRDVYDLVSTDQASAGERIISSSYLYKIKVN